MMYNDFQLKINKKKRRRLTAFLLVTVLFVCFFTVFVSATEDTTPDVPIVTNPVTKAEISSLPDKKIYRVGEELDVAGAKLKLTFQDGSFNIVNVNSNWCSGFNSSKAGETTVTVLYPFGGGAVTFKVTVKDLAGIRISKTPKKTEYFVGEHEDPAGLEVTQVFTDGSTEKLSKGYSSSGFETVTAGTKTVVISYGGFSASYKITVKGRTVTNISVKSAPTKTRVFIGDAFDSTGMQIIATYNDKSTGDVTEYVTVTGFDTTEIGTKTVTVRFLSGSASFTDSFTIVVAEPQVTGIEIAFPPEKLTYLAGDPFDPTGMAVSLVYENGKRENVTEGFSLSGFSSEQIGTKTVTVTLNGFTTTFDVLVIVDETHVHSGTEKITILAPTCTAEGSEGTVCHVCGETFNVVPVDPVPHTFGDWTHVLEPTPEAEGKYTRQCSVCQYAEEIAVPKLTATRENNEVTAMLTGDNYFPVDMNFYFKDAWMLLSGTELTSYNTVAHDRFGAEVFGAFDLEFSDGAGASATPAAPVIYSVPLDRISNSASYDNLRLLKDGNPVEFTLNGGNIVFTSDSPGRFVLAGTPIVITTAPAETTAEPTDTETTPNESEPEHDETSAPETTQTSAVPGRSSGGIPSGIGTMLIIVISILFVIAILIAVYFLTIRRYY